MSKFTEFMNKYKGIPVDVDGAYGEQCVDLFNAWNRDYNGCYINCRPSGYAKSLAENKANNGILKYFTETPVNNMIEGTVVVWGNCKSCPNSHVGFFIKDNGNGSFQCFHQHVQGKNYPLISNMKYEGIIGAFIPNQLLCENSNKVEETKKLYLPASSSSWRVYAMDKEPVKKKKDGSENATGFLNPKKFGGLEYDILGWTWPNVAIIQTRDFGKVQIYVAPSTGAIIK